MSTPKQTSFNESDLLSVFTFRYVPYWPLFVILSVICLGAGWIYGHYTTPVYEASATIIIKDEKKGVEDSKALEELNLYTSKKIVENETEVIHSRTLMKEAVLKLHLYAPIYTEGRVRGGSAYLTSPVVIEAQDPNEIEEQEKVPFTFDEEKKLITIGAEVFPLNEWVTTPYGNLRFSPNPKKSRETSRDLYFSLVDPKALAMDLLENLEVTGLSKLSTVVNLKYKDIVPERAEDVLNELIEAYDRAAIDDKNLLATHTLNFVEDRLERVQGELDSIERKIQSYKSQKGIVDLSEQGRVFLQNVGDNDRKLSDINMQLAVLNQVETYVLSKDTKEGIVPSTLGVDEPVLSQLLQKLYSSEIEYEKLRKTTAENNPILASLAYEIEKIRPNILENVRNQRNNLLASRANLTSTNYDYNTMLKSIPTKERELLEISRQQAIKSSVYSYLLQKREETALTHASAVADSRIIDEAEADSKPVAPKKMLIYIASIMLAFGAGIAYVNMREVFTNKVLFRHEIQKYTNAPIAGELTHVDSKSPLVIGKEKFVVVTEQFRQMRASIGLYGRQFSKRKILVTSSISGEGKSFVSNNLALSLSSSGRSVVLVDIDIRNPKTSAVFGESSKRGVTDYLLGKMEPYEIIRKTNFKGLHIVPAGKSVINPTELLLSDKLSILFQYLESQFDYVIVDTSPIDPVSDAYVLSEYCDTTLFVVRHRKTPKAMVQLLNESNKVKALNNLAIVFNGVKPRGFGSKGFGYGYGYGYENVYKERVYGTKVVTKA